MISCLCMMCSERRPGSVVFTAGMRRKDEHACRLRAGHDGVRVTLVLVKTAFSAASLHFAFCVGVVMLQVRDEDHSVMLFSSLHCRSGVTGQRRCFACIS